MTPSKLLAVSFELRSLRSSHKFIAILVCTDEFFKNYPPKRIFRNESISNLENVLQRNLRTDTAMECIFKVSECINLEKIFRSAPTMVASSWVRCVYQCDHKIMDTSLIVIPSSIKGFFSELFQAFVSEVFLPVTYTFHALSGVFMCYIFGSY